MPLILYTSLVLYFSSTLTICSPSPVSARSNPFPANPYIYTWSEPGCNYTDGTKTTVLENSIFSYSVMWSIGQVVQSYMLNRTLEMWERLDWSTKYAKGTMPDGGVIPEDCGIYQQTTNPDSNAHVLREMVYYPLVGGAECVNIWNTSCAPIYDPQTGSAIICKT